LWLTSAFALEGCGELAHDRSSEGLITESRVLGGGVCDAGEHVDLDDVGAQEARRVDSECARRAEELD
jgi:hypothetical protein